MAAGNAAAASRPPLTADRCLRTRFIVPIGAPDRSSAVLIACLSAKVIPGAGSASSDEPPPEINASTRSSAPRPDTRSRIRRARCWPAASGTGCAACTTSTCEAGHRVPVTGHHQPGQRAVPGLLDGLRHPGRRLAGADHDDPPGWRHRQEGCHALQRVRGCHCRIEHRAQQRQRISHRLAHASHCRSRLSLIRV